MSGLPNTNRNHIVNSQDNPQSPGDEPGDRAATGPGSNANTSPSYAEICRQAAQRAQQIEQIQGFVQRQQVRDREPEQREPEQREPEQGEPEQRSQPLEDQQRQDQQGQGDLGTTIRDQLDSASPSSLAFSDASGPVLTPVLSRFSTSEEIISALLPGDGAPGSPIPEGRSFRPSRSRFRSDTAPAGYESPTATASHGFGGGLDGSDTHLRLNGAVEDVEAVAEVNEPRQLDTLSDIDEAPPPYHAIHEDRQIEDSYDRMHLASARATDNEPRDVDQLRLAELILHGPPLPDHLRNIDNWPLDLGEYSGEEADDETQPMAIEPVVERGRARERSMTGNENAWIPEGHPGPANMRSTVLTNRGISGKPESEASIERHRRVPQHRGLRSLRDTPMDSGISSESEYVRNEALRGGHLPARGSLLTPSSASMRSGDSSSSESDGLMMKPISRLRVGCCSSEISPGRAPRRPAALQRPIQPRHENDNPITFEARRAQRNQQRHEEQHAMQRLRRYAELGDDNAWQRIQMFEQGLVDWEQYMHRESSHLQASHPEIAACSGYNVSNLLRANVLTIPHSQITYSGSCNPRRLLPGCLMCSPQASGEDRLNSSSGNG